MVSSAAAKAALDARTIGSAEVSARRMWDVPPPAPGAPPVIFMGEMISLPDMRHP
jgi:hypothetical protein